MTNRYRLALKILLILVVVVRGFDFAAPLDSSVEHGESSANTDMPCHAKGKTAPMPCCDSACPDMTSCALSHPAIATVAAAPPLPLVAVFPLLRRVDFSSHTPAPLLRPPTTRRT